jgi:hypothetical protein
MHYSLCDMFSDLTQNAVEAGANDITVKMEQTEREIFFSVGDNGKGMSPEQQRRATDPFYTDGSKHPGRKIGLGIPFLIQTAEATGGTWSIRSDNGVAHGTTVECHLDLTNLDTPPVGDVTGFFRQILTFDGTYEMTIERKTPTVSYTVCRSELLDAMGLSDEGSFTDAASLALLEQYLESQEN